MKKALVLLLYAFYLFCSGRASAQIGSIDPDSLQARLALYSKINAQGLLYVHTDKTLYTNNEPIWFAGYLINAGLGNLTQHSIISVSLMREDDRRIICEQQNVMDNGLSAGSMIIPDNAPPGNYLFNACTNVLDQHGKPIAVFSQPITIKSIADRRFNATLALLDTVAINGVIRASVVLSIKDEKRLGKPTIAYAVGGSKQEKITLSDKQSSASFGVPAKHLNAVDPILLAEVAYNYDTVYLSVKLPKVRARGINVRFFPEGGNLIDGLESTIAIETTTKTGLQLPLTGTLYKNDTPIETLSTNSYGIGRFKLRPSKGSIYTFRVKANNYLNKDTAYTLPDIIENGVVIRFNEAVVNDTLRMTLYSKASKKVQVAVHNYNEAFSLFNTEAKPEGKKLSMVLPALPKGIATVTLLDEDGKPLAERLFFAHYNQAVTATIKTDKQSYDKRDSVGVTLTLKDHSGNPVEGVLSIAAVQESRLEGAKQQDIESYVYLNSYLGTLPRDPMGRGFDNKPYLENMFLTRGWRRFTWQGLMQGTAADTLSMGLMPQITGNMLHNGKSLKKSKDIILLKSPVPDKFSTAADGSFILSRQQLEVEEGKTVRVWLELPNEYEVKVKNPFPAINNDLAKEAVIVTRGTALSAESSQDQQLKGFEKKNMLKEAVIRADKKDEMFGHANACGDYVCINKILNCRNHTPWNSIVRPAVKGEVTSAGVYEGCTNGQIIPNIYLAREFYGLNRDPDTSFEPQYLSTLFWQPGLVTNEKGEASFHFFTSDVVGKYKIVVQGVGLNAVVNGMADLVVK